MAEIFEITEVHPEDDYHNRPEKCIVGLRGYWVDLHGSWKDGIVNGYEHGIFRPLEENNNVILYAVKTKPVKGI